MSTISYFRPALPFIDAGFRAYLRRHLNGIYVDGPLPLNRERLTVLLCQHISLFDGFAVRHMVMETGTKDRVVTIMLDSQLKQHPILRMVGAMGITPGSIASARRLKTLIQDELVPSDIVVLFPQGRIETIDGMTDQFATGYQHFDHPHIETDFIPVALSFEALVHPKPTMFMKCGQPVDVTQAGMALVDTSKRLRSWLIEHGESSDKDWPGERLL